MSIEIPNVSKTKMLFVTLFLNFCLFSSAQTEVLNQFDSAGKKHGKWLIYWNGIWKEMNDSSAAIYCRYTYYDHGQNLFPMGPCGRKKWKLESKPSQLLHIGKLILLDGKYSWIDEKGHLSSVQIFNKGEYIEAREMHSNDQVEQDFEYSKKYKDEFLSWKFTSYTKEGKVKYVGYFRKGEKGWMIYPDYSGNEK